MKKLFLMAAFAGLLSGTAVAGNFGDDKDAKKKECKKGEKSCAGEKTGCNKEEKSCCKKKSQACGEKTSSDVKPTPAPAEKKS
jgi:hypothetical protein